MEDKTQNRHELFNLLGEFTINTLTGAISSVYRSQKFGRKYLLGDGWVSIVLPFLEEYFNVCVQMIENRKDVFINQKFDEMIEINVSRDGNRPSHPLDLLQIIVLLTIGAVGELPVPHLVKNYPGYDVLMPQVQQSIREFVYSERDKFIPDLCGCPPEHNHSPTAGERVFTFSTDKYVIHEGKKVRMSTLHTSRGPGKNSSE